MTKRVLEDHTIKSGTKLMVYENEDIACLLEYITSGTNSDHDTAPQRASRNLRTVDWSDTTMYQNLKKMDWNVTTNGRSFILYFNFLVAHYEELSLLLRIRYAFRIIQYIYFPVLAGVGFTVNILTIVILPRGKCGLSRCVTRYLVAMAVTDLLVIILDLILRHIPILYQKEFHFVRSFHVCNIHAVLLHATTDCSVWFTVSFTFGRFVAICCQKLKTKYCTERTAAVVLGTVTLLIGFKNIFWYFMLTGFYILDYMPWFCYITDDVLNSPVWGAITFLHYILTPCIPFALILLLNTVTARHIVLASRARRQLRGASSGECPSDPEMASRRNSIILLFVISGNFILLWAVLMVNSIWTQMYFLGYDSVYIPIYVMDVGIMLQLLSCCTNTAIYAVTQTKFRQQLKNVGKYPFTLILKLIKR
uniref:probable G-protein coupled receptor 139 n=1 Tax=Pristiophorus japonicus TaxID=55135 RepID=UPI00398E50A3